MRATLNIISCLCFSTHNSGLTSHRLLFPLLRKHQSCRQILTSSRSSQFWNSCVNRKDFSCESLRPPILASTSDWLRLLTATRTFVIQKQTFSASSLTSQGMNAVILSSFGGPENLSWGHTDNVPSEPGPGKIIIRVKASAINRADTLQRRGTYPPPKGESDILGLEAAGVVHKCGPDCSKFAPGDRVMALVPGGGNAQFVVVNENHAMRVPENLSFEHATAIPEVWITAFQMMFVVADKFAASLGKGEQQKSAVVHAGASGVGTALIQLLKVVNVRCYVTAGSDDKINYCKSLGAAGGFNYKDKSEKSWDERLLEQEPQGVDLILDPVGGNYFAQNLKVLKTDASLVLYGLLGGNKIEGPYLGSILGKRLNIYGTTLRTRSDEYKQNLITRFENEMVPKFATGELKPVVDKVMPISQIKEAHELMESNTTVGKIVLTIPE